MQFSAEVVRHFDEKTIKDIIHINSDSFPAGWSYFDAERYYGDMLKKDSAIHIFLKKGDDRVGYLLAIAHNDAVREIGVDDPMMKGDPARYYMETVSILPEFRGNHGFSEMLKKLEDELKAINISAASLHARVSNNFSAAIQRKMLVTKIRRIDKWKYYNYEEPTDYIEAGFK